MRASIEGCGSVGGGEVRDGAIAKDVGGGLGSERKGGDTESE